MGIRKIESCVRNHAKLVTLMGAILLVDTVQGLGVPENNNIAEKDLLDSSSKSGYADGQGAILKSVRSGRTFNFLNWDSYRPGPMPPFQSGIMPPPPPPSYYHQSYYDSGPFIFLRAVGSVFLETLIRVFLTPNMNQPMDYSNSDYDGSPSNWQSEFNNNDNEYP